METLTKQAVTDFIIENHKTMSVTEMANELGLTIGNVRAKYVWLVRKNVIQVEQKTKVVKKTSVSESVAKFSKSIKKIDSLYEKIKKESKNTYQNHKGINKQNAREIMKNAIVESGVVGVIPTLPNTEWAIEQMIDNEVKGNNFLGVERDAPTYKKMKQTLNKIRKNGFVGGSHFGDIASIIYGKNENSFAHLILDYCGNLVTIKNELEYAINKNILAVDGVMAVTFSKPIRGIDNESKKLLNLAPKNNSDERCQSDRAIESYFHKITGFTHEVVEFFYYRDSYPMTLVIIKRVK
jgi:predicted transcriptional regulator